VPGATFEIGVLLDAKEPVDIEWCDVRVTGTLRYGETTEALLTPLEARLCEARQLPTGTTHLPARLALPTSVPRSHPGRIVYEVHVHASVPWWPDARATFALHVVGPAADAPIEGQARIGVSHTEVPPVGVPYAELSLGTDVFEVGTVIDGRVAIRDADDARTTVALVSFEKIGERPPERSTAWSITLPAPATPFALSVPPDVTPTFETPRFALSYWIMAESMSSMLTLVRAAIPVRIVEAGRARSTTRIVAPHVGDKRLEELFAQVGAAEGAVVEPGPTLVIRRGQVEARARRELGADGTRVAVTVKYPELFLDLHVYEPALVALAPRARRVARNAGLSPRCVVVARDTEQATTFLETFAAPLARARAVDMNDTAARYAVLTAANDRASLGRVVHEIGELATQLARPVPLPEPLRLARREWEALARDLDGTLEPGHARVLASTPDATIVIATLFQPDGVPFGTSVSTRPTRELLLDAPIVLVDGPVPGSLAISPEARSALTKLLHFGRVRADRGEIRVTLDLVLGGAVPPARGREIVEASLRFASTLRTSRGPFR